MSKDEALRTALKQAYNLGQIYWQQADSEYMSQHRKADLTEAKFKELVEATVAALEAKDEPYAFEASMYPRVIIDPVTGNVSIGTVTKPCGLECDCTDVCEQETDYKALWQQMCERCDELDKKLAQRKPLTDEQAMDAYFETPPFGTYKEAFIAGIRFIEAAHGIKGEA